MAARMLTAFNVRFANCPVVFCMGNIPANLSLIKTLLQFRGESLLETNQTTEGVAGVSILIQVEHLMATLVPLHPKALSMVAKMGSLTIATALCTSNSVILKIVLKSVTRLVPLHHLQRHIFQATLLCSFVSKNDKQKVYG